MRYLVISILSIFILGSFASYAVADDCKKAVELYNKGTLSNDYGEKLRCFKEALRLSCEDKEILAKIHNNLADAYENKGMFKEASEEYKKAVKLKPDLPTPYISLGDVYSKMGNNDSAGEYYDRYLKLTQFKKSGQIRSSLSLRSATRTIIPVPSEELYFGFDEEILTEGSERQLDELLAALKDDELKSYRFQLAGQTCNIGSNEYNQKLSERRAGAVKEWLVAHGYPGRQLTTVGFGEKNPVADNSTEEGRRINRRVEIRTTGVMVTSSKRNRSLEEEHAAALINEGLRLYGEGKYKEAASIFEKALRISKKENLRVVIDLALGNLYLVYLSLGDENEAKKYLKELKYRD